MLLPVLYIHVCAFSAHTRVHVSISASATHLWLAATPLSVGILETVTRLAYQAYYSVSTSWLTGNHRKVSGGKWWLQ